MSVFNSFFDIFKKNSDIETSVEFDDFFQEISQRSYLKRMAIDKCVNFVAKSLAQTEFKTYENGKLNKDLMYYKLNVRPNTDDSASRFWQKAFTKMIKENEVLIILNDSNDLLIADSFIRNEYANYDDNFTGVTVKNYQFKRVFKMNEVIYLTYNNERLERYTDSLFDDYGKLLGRMIEINMRNNQIRSIFKADLSQGTDEEKAEKLNRYAKLKFKKFKEESFAVVPLTKGMEYEEKQGNNVNASQSIDEINKLKKQAVDEVAEMIGVPPSLIHGDVADLKSNMDAYIKFLIKPELKKIRDELNSTLYTPNEFLKGCEVQTIGIDKLNVFELSEAIDKIIGSGTYTGDEVRIKLGDEPTGLPEMQEHHITKNYQTLKGGE